MTSTKKWIALEPDLETVFSCEDRPLQALADNRIPGIVLRKVYNQDHCQGLIQRFIERGMMRDPENPTAELKGTYQIALVTSTSPNANKPSSTRIDIGTSLANRT